jgi:hypothetical protein
MNLARATDRAARVDDAPGSVDTGRAEYGPGAAAGHEIFHIISEIKAPQVADYAYVLERGLIAYQDQAASLRQDTRIISAHLG